MKYAKWDIKRVDEKTQRRMYWFCVPPVLVLLIFMLYACWDINIFESWFGLDVDIYTDIIESEWRTLAMSGYMLFVFLVYAIIAIRQKCWGELAITAVLMIIFILNMFNVFVPEVI